MICEIAIAACDLAEVIGSAIALNLLFHIPLTIGVILTAADVLVVLLLQHEGLPLARGAGDHADRDDRHLLSVRGRHLASHRSPACSRDSFRRVSIVRDPEMLYIAMGILGATVMPHNLYLHSSIVQTRRYEETAAGKREAVRFAFLDSTIALTFALFINAAILIVAAATFHTSGHTDVAEIQQAYKLLTPLLGVGGASAVFALALLASGQNSTLTGTLAGQIVMEGFLHLRLRPWVRRLITRGHRHCAGGGGRHSIWRVRNREAARDEPGGAQPAAVVCGVPAGALHLGSREDGGVRERRRGCECCRTRWRSSSRRSTSGSSRSF